MVLSIFMPGGDRRGALIDEGAFFIRTDYAATPRVSRSSWLFVALKGRHIIALKGTALGNWVYWFLSPEGATYFAPTGLE